MPKELTHWIIAEQIYKSMSSSSLKTSIEKHRGLYYIGAVALDTPFYLRGRSAARFAVLANRLHGLNNENTFEPLINLIRYCGQSVSPAVWSFLCGALSHIMVDGQYHPLVYSLTGDYYDPDLHARASAVCNHRRWEARLDLFYSSNLQLIKPELLAESLKASTISEEELISLLAVLYFGNDALYRNEIKSAVRAHSFMTSVFSNKWFFRLLSAINTISRGKYQSSLALFYPRQGNTDIKYFSSQFEYRHPATGELICETLQDIQTRAIDKTLVIVNQWSQAKSIPDLLEFLSKTKGPSLETGL